MAFYLLPAPAPPPVLKNYLTDVNPEDDAGGSTAPGNTITSEVITLNTKQPESWTIEPAQPNQGPITKGSPHPFYIISKSTGDSFPPPPPPPSLSS
jgi:hypothetical protein